MHITNKPLSMIDFLTDSPGETCGAAASFFGIVRNHNEGKCVKKLLYDCYRPMAEKEIRSIILEAQEEWGVEEIRVIHRVGELQIGETAVGILVYSAHRNEAFAACRQVIERIKHRVPIWKKEFYEDGTAEWVGCKHAALA